MEARAQIKYVRMSPLKLRELIPVVKILPPQHALDRLKFSQQRNARALYKAIQSAVANAQSIAGFDVQKATFKTLKIDEGPYFRRYRAGSKGSAKPYVRKTSHITVVLEQKGAQFTAQAPKKAVEKPEVIAEAPAKVETKQKAKPAVKKKAAAKKANIKDSKSST